jgi:hypothetical protein
MAWAIFTAPFDWSPPGAQWTISYKAGHRYNIPRETLDKAIKAGAATAARSPKLDAPAETDTEAAEAATEAADGSEVGR